MDASESASASVTGYPTHPTLTLDLRCDLLSSRARLTGKEGSDVHASTIGFDGAVGWWAPPKSHPITSLPRSKEARTRTALAQK
jgi:hypothetical protein